MSQDYFGRLSLAEQLRTRSFRPDFYKLAAALADMVKRIHDQGRILGDLNPVHFLWNPETAQLRLVEPWPLEPDWQANPGLQPPSSLEGSLPYMSPEQTGRMNRPVDYRSDFYGLGVLYYQLLTGTLPFPSSDPLELVHAHLARRPDSPHRLFPSIPAAISDLVMKLLEKEADDRYQSAEGLLADLDRCRQAEESGQGPFPLGQADYSEQLTIPGKLYGRQREIHLLLESFQRAAEGGRELFLIGGYSGAGKTSLVREIHKPMTARHGYFFEGKFNSLQSPYLAWIQAFTSGVHYLLMESDLELSETKRRIIQAVKTNGRVLTDVIPDLEWIIGPQPRVPGLSPAEAQNRFHYVFQEFVKALASPEHPLVIFLDDLQWIDLASLNLLEALYSGSEIAYFQVIGSYRSNEIGPRHPLRKLPERLGGRTGVADLELGNLTETDVAAMLADMLRRPGEDVRDLARLLHAKTAGNAFFVHQVLRRLAEAGAFSFNREHRRWEWSAEHLAALEITENIAVLMADKLMRLPEKSQQLLIQAACLGNPFDRALLELIAEAPATVVQEALETGLRENLLLPAGRDHAEQYRFAHDRVLQAAYALIPEEHRAGTHLRIARHLLQGLSPEARDENLFAVANHLNLGAPLLQTPAEKKQAAEINLAAGRKAKAAAAYDSAYAYLRKGLHRLPDDSWASDYPLTLALHEEAADTAYLSNDFPEAERLVAVILRQARGIADQIRAYEIRINFLIAQEKLLEAVREGLNLLRRMGLSIPENPRPHQTLLHLLVTTLAVRSKAGNRIEALGRLPAMTDASAMAKIRILEAIGSAAYLAVPGLIPLLPLIGVGLSVRYGNSPVSPYFYAAYGLILSAAVGKIETGNRFGELALSLLEPLNAERWASRVGFLVYNFIFHTRQPLKKTLAPLLEAHRRGLENGDFEYAARSLLAYGYTMFLSGTELTAVEQVMQEADRKIRQLRQGTPAAYNQLFHQTAANLMGQSPDPCRMAGQHFDESRPESKRLKQHDTYARSTLHYLKLFLNYLFGRYAEAVRHASQVDQNAILGLSYMSQYVFYDALARLAVYPGAGRREQAAIRRRVAANQKKLSAWAGFCPENHLHRHLLVEAERARLKGDALRAADLYEKSLQAAEKSGFVYEEAIAYERAADFWLAGGKEDLGRQYMARARQVYRGWQAWRKVSDLESQHPWLAPKTEAGMEEGGGNRLLDLQTALKATQTIAGEMEQERLLARIMKIVIENAGAQSASLILAAESGPVIAAQGGVDQPVLARAVPVREDAPLAASVVHYVLRTMRSVVLDDAAHHGDFVNDAHIRKHSIKSLICAPLLNRGRLIGAFYMENNLTTHAFTANRIQLLEVMLSQAATSLENARVYDALRQSEARFRAIFETVNDAILIHDLGRGKILDANQKAVEMFGYPREELLALSLGELSSGVPPFAAGDVLRWVKAAADAPQLHDWQAKDRSGRLLWIQINMRKAVIASQEIVLATARDISERKQYEQALQQEIQERRQIEDNLRQSKSILSQKTADLLEADRQKNQFLAMLAHELRNPLAPIRNSLELIRSKHPEDDASTDKWLGVMNRQVNHLAHIVDDLLDAARVSRDAITLKIARLDIRELVSQTVDISRPFIESHKQELTVSLPEEPAVVNADPVRLTQILFNLLNNASKFTPEKGTISLTVRKAANHLAIEIRDNGAGISPEHLPHLFKLFFQADQSLDRTKGGLGLGLALVQRLTKLHGGRVDVSSPGPGLGSTFTVRLPLADAAAGAAALEPAEAAAAPLDILIAEDNQELGESLAEVLRFWGHKVQVSLGGPDALQQAGETRPELLLLDAEMAGLDLGAFLSRLRPEPGPSSMLVAIMTNRHPEDFESLGLDGVLAKPLHLPALNTFLQNLGRRKAAPPA